MLRFSKKESSSGIIGQWYYLSVVIIVVSAVEFNAHQDASFYSPTPPIEALRTIMHIAAKLDGRCEGKGPSYVRAYTEARLAATSHFYLEMGID